MSSSSLQLSASQLPADPEEEMPGNSTSDIPGDDVSVTSTLRSLPDEDTPATEGEPKYIPTPDLLRSPPPEPEAPVKYIPTPDMIRSPPPEPFMWSQGSASHSPLSAGYWMTYVTPEPVVPEESSNDENSAASKQLLTVLEVWLATPYASSLATFEGFVTIRDILSVCVEAKELSGNSLATVVKAVRNVPPDGAIQLHHEGRSLRLRGLVERVRLAAEMHMTFEAEDGSMSLLDLLASRSVASLVEDIPEAYERLETLQEALRASHVVQVCGSRAMMQQWYVDQWGQTMVAQSADADRNHNAQKDKANKIPGKAQSTSAAADEENHAMDVSNDNPESSPADDTDNMERSLSTPAGDPNAAISLEGVGMIDASTEYTNCFVDGSDPWWSETWPMVWWPEVWPMQGMPMTWDYSQDVASAGRRDKFKAKKLPRSMYITKVIRELLENPSPEVRENMEDDGSVKMLFIFQLDQTFAKNMFYNPNVPIRTILRTPENYVLGADSTMLTVWLLDTSEKLCKASEWLLTNTGESLALTDLLAYPAIQSILSEFAASSGEGASENFNRLQHALLGSDLLEIDDDNMVSIRPANVILEKVLCDFLDTDARCHALFETEGEIPLSFFLEEVSLQAAFKQGMVYGSDAQLDVLRTAIQSLKGYALEGSSESSQLSVRRAGTSKPMKPTIRSNGRQNGRCIPMERDAKQLRKLIEWYFEPFNLQHNRVLMAAVRACRNANGTFRGANSRPTFSLQDICGLPRISKILEQYDPDAGPWMLGVLMHTDRKLPIRLLKAQVTGAPRGSWANRVPRIELAYVPDFRFVETLAGAGKRPEVQPLLRPDIDPFAPVKPLPGNAFSVVSYNVSSDLSHSQSPKALKVLDKIVSAGLEPGMLQWSVRQPLIKRQLLQFGSDFICVQGLQSIGMADRCSEWDDGWFQGDDEPETNHLVHLYRELSVHNYGVVFAPTLRLPGSDVMCFGNAIFWKRSRWQLAHRWSVPLLAVCAEFTSKLFSQGVLVSSSKNAASYAADWGDETSAAELVQPNLVVQETIKESIRLRNVQPVWCGDFGCDLGDVIQGLSLIEEEFEWQNASTSVLGHTPWTKVSEGEEDLVVAMNSSAKKENLAVDFMLHDESLQPLAALGGHQERIAVQDWFESGHPSEHLLQMAVFVSNQGFANFTEQEWPALV